MPYRRPEPTGGEREAPRQPAPRHPDAALVGAAVWRRAVAATLDTVVVFAPAIGVYVLLHTVLEQGSCQRITGFYGEQKLVNCSGWALMGTWLITVLVFLAAAFMVEVGPTSGGRRSLGRRLVKIEAVDGGTGDPIGLSRASGRFLFRTFISTILGLGFLWMILDDRDRTLHDIVCRSAVVGTGSNEFALVRR
jgi:uncharacterized RDD family membrane protein YckC